ncbi:MAG: hypothetical protein E2591_26690 [Achromobacter sp.]|uniref:hypothetical protein n=1 Tax=Achromobacter sp. TaxID=134375 RepID=UPI0012BFDDC9|nr:hypothetical protein [Achromobacter sp.]MPS81666.1 hypothetical protein [Achromobacter sp.]
MQTAHVAPTTSKPCPQGTPTSPVGQPGGLDLVATANSERPGDHEYLFDLRLFASIRFRANSVREAREMLSASLQCVTANLGAWPDGSPIMAEVSADDTADVMEIDGVET